MAETITIPSPSVFLRASPDRAPPADKAQESVNERKRSTAKKKKTASAAANRTVENAAVSKPKQSKSRNGTQDGKTTWLLNPLKPVIPSSSEILN